MTFKFLKYNFLIAAILGLAVVSCKKVPLPTVPGSPIVILKGLVTINSATFSDVVSSDGGLPITHRGMCWSTLPFPTIANSKTTDGSGTGSFTSNITGMNSGTTYYIRAYVTNNAGTAYGPQIIITTVIDAPATLPSF